MKAARPTSLEPVLNLARNLAEEFDTVPLPMVSRAVKSAVQATALFGDKVADSRESKEGEVIRRGQLDSQHAGEDVLERFPCLVRAGRQRQEVEEEVGAHDVAGAVSQRGIGERLDDHLRPNPGRVAHGDCDGGTKVIH